MRHRLLPGRAQPIPCVGCGDSCAATHAARCMRQTLGRQLHDHAPSLLTVDAKCIILDFVDPLLARRQRLEQVGLYPGDGAAARANRSNALSQGQGAARCPNGWTIVG
jgi:hypothetical protein